jgi:hypothetical protein
MTTTIAATKPTVRYHPIRGAVYGLFFGLGLALLLMVFKVLALSVPLIIVLGLVFLILGGVWGRFAPPRPTKEPPPARPTITGTPRTTAVETPTATPATPPTGSGGTPAPPMAQPQPPAAPGD